MSMIRCEQCGTLIDSDEDPECFTEYFKPSYGENGGELIERVLCPTCRGDDD